MRYAPYPSLREHPENIARFGTGINPIEAITKSL
ncbi:hypothetical protein ACUXAV_006191 [Cupriavidus metallidurans]